jgi:hypothetical protein
MGRLDCLSADMPSIIQQCRSAQLTAIEPEVHPDFVTNVVCVRPLLAGARRFTCSASQVLNRVGFRLYERLRPDVPEGAQGWGAKAGLRLERIVGAAG